MLTKNIVPNCPSMANLLWRIFYGKAAKKSQGGEFLQRFYTAYLWSVCLHRMHGDEVVDTLWDVAHGFRVVTDETGYFLYDSIHGTEPVRTSIA